MHKIRHKKMLVVLVLGIVVASACTQTYSQAPLATPTLISTGLFVSPFPSGQDPLQVVAQLGTQTAAAKTATAGGPSSAGTAAASTTATAGTSVAATSTATLGGTGATSAATTAAASTVVPVTKSPTPQPTVLATSVVVVPATYTLQAGEFPYCIARRFNINPDQLLSANGISDGSILYPGKVLNIPQGAGPFPGDRALHDHPDTYTVPSSDTTIYGVACYYGNVLPQDIAAANGLTLSSALTAGKQLTIP